MSNSFKKMISVMGVPTMGMSGIPVTYGNVYFVDYDNGNDGNVGTRMDRAFKTLEYAYGKVVSNNNDVLVLSANSTHALSAMLSVSKNRVHFIGMDTGGRMYGQRARISLGVTGVATNIATILNTGVGNTFRNLKISNADTVTEGVYTVAEGGEYALYENCEIYKSSHLSTTASAELLLNGDSAQFHDCTFGSLVDIVADNMIRPCVLLTRETISGKVCRDCHFSHCFFWRKTAGVEARHVYSAGATDVERLLLFENCVFLNAKLSTASMAYAVGGAATQTEGLIVLRYCTVANCNATIEASRGIYIDGAVPTFATSGKAVAS